jgi:hypothetical protein
MIEYIGSGITGSNHKNTLILKMINPAEMSGVH